GPLGGSAAATAASVGDHASAALLDIRNLVKTFVARRGFMGGKTALVYALSDISFSVAPGEAFGLVGESGCGKSTAGRAILRLIEPNSGTVLFRGENVFTANARRMRSLRRQMQIVFQDPYSSLNPRRTIGRTLSEPMNVHGLGTKGEIRAIVQSMLAEVGLPSDAADKYPHEFSGGQRQRIGIARALALSPELIVSDEPVSALDVSIQAQIINLLMDLQDELKLSYLFVAHDLAVVEHISDRVALMYLGRIVETTGKTSLFETPLHPYTEALLSAVPIPIYGARDRKRVILTGDVPSPINPPPGCHFHTRCPYAMARCRRDAPTLREMLPGHWASCHLHD